MKPLPIRRLTEGIVWWIRICLYFSTFIIPSILIKLPSPFAVKNLQIIIEPLLCLTVGFKYTSFVYSPSLFLTCLLFDMKISNFDSSLHNRFFPCWTVHFLCSLANSSSFSAFLSLIRFPSGYSIMKIFFHKCSSDGWRLNLGARCFLTEFRFGFFVLIAYYLMSKPSF